MNRFSKWLIHKLGGLTEEDVVTNKPKLIFEDLQPVKKYYYRQIIPYSDRCISEIEIQSIERQMIHKFVEILKPKFVVNESLHGLEIVLEIEMLVKYMKELEDEI